LTDTFANEGDAWGKVADFYNEYNNVYQNPSLVYVNNSNVREIIEENPSDISEDDDSEDDDGPPPLIGDDDISPPLIEVITLKDLCE
jgi:hypothetical protein